MGRPGLDTIWIAAASCVLAIGAHAGGRDGFAAPGELIDPAMFPQEINDQFGMVNVKVKTEQRKRRDSFRAVRCFDSGQTYPAKQWRACERPKVADSSSCRELNACRKSGHRGLIQDRKAVLCDRLGQVVPFSKWKACLKLRDAPGASSDASCSEVFDCEGGSYECYPADKRPRCGYSYSR